MNKLTFFTILLVELLIFGSCENTDNSNPNDIYPITSCLHHDSFYSESLHGCMGIMNQSVRFVNVYIPPGYNEETTRKYPVIYLLHGLPFSEKAFTDIKTWDEWVNPNGIFKEYPDFPEEGFRLWVDSLIESGIIEPVIIAMPNAEKWPYGFSFYTNSLPDCSFEDYITKDLISYIDNHYRTNASANGRAVIGYSQGGYAAFKFGMQHSDTFSTIASHSGLLVLDAVLGMGPLVVAENPDGFTGLDGFAGMDHTKFFTCTMYAMSAAWSPNLYAPDGIDLPFEWPSGNIIPEVRKRWLQHDVFTQLDSHINELKLLKGIYFDVGNKDELETGTSYPYIIQKLDKYGIDYHFETFEGGHFDKMFERLAISLAFCSDALKK